MEIINVFVGTTNARKIEAVTAAYKRAYPEDQVEVKGVEAASGVDEQPVGSQMGRQGAVNRLTETRQQITNFDTAAATQTHFVGIENFIEEQPLLEGETTSLWLDIAWVVVCAVINDQEMSAVATSAGIPFPTESVQKAAEKGFVTTTAGSIMAQESEIDGKDPHRSLTDGVVPRTQFLEQAVAIALGQIRYTSKKS